MNHGQLSLHSHRPAVYLDQWVWIKLARANRGRPEAPWHLDVLEAVREAAADGVAFPLSATHYLETARIRDPRQRQDLVDVMAPVSAMRTLRGGREPIRHQLLVALHESVGRPAFRPTPPQMLGLGASWAVQGVQASMRVLDSEGSIVDNADPAWLRHVNQYTEACMLAGPPDEEVPSLRAMGYRTAQEVDTQPGSRLDWEKAFSEQLKSHAPSRAELRIWLLARELTHEHQEVFDEVLSEYRLRVSDLAGGSDYSRQNRQRLVAFVDLVPSLRIAAEMKLEMFRNRSREWSWNMISDIDFLSRAVPYCQVVVADRDAASIFKRSGAEARLQATVISQLRDLPDALAGPRSAARQIDGDPTGWDSLIPGAGFRMNPPAHLSPSVCPGASQGWTVRSLDPDGRPSMSAVRRDQAMAPPPAG